MKDGFERRALLLQVGEALKAVSGKPGKGPGALVARAAVSAEDRGNPALLVAQAYASWASLLLAETLNKSALAKAVSPVFAGDLKGWKAYLKAVQKDVPDFGEGVTVEASAASAAPGDAKTGLSAPSASATPESASKPADESTTAPPAPAKASSEPNTGEPPSTESAGESSDTPAAGSISANWPWKPAPAESGQGSSGTA